MDSCNVMRGSKTGLETRIRREKAPHLLDIDGDELLKKKLTKDGKDRQLRIVDKLFHERKLAKLIMGLYSSVFPLLKSFDTFRDEGTSNSLVTRRSG